MGETHITGDQEIAYGGERVTHLYPNDCYFAHLSIYYFALSQALNKQVFDAGCGSGYGSFYIAEHGAEFVEGVDISAIAIEFDRKHFKRDNLHFQVMSLEDINQFPDQEFDLIYTSNVLEHVPEVSKFFAHSTRLLKQDGQMIIAVPPVVDDNSRQININNPYHLNIWTPRQWQAVIGEFYEEVESYYHTFDQPGIVLNFDNTPQETRVTEKDFIFRKCQVDDFYKSGPITTVFIARKPKKMSGIHPGQIRYIENSFTRPYSVPQVKRSSPSLITKGLKVIKDHGVLTFIKDVWLYGKKVIKSSG